MSIRHFVNKILAGGVVVDCSFTGQYIVDVNLKFRHIAITPHNNIVAVLCDVSQLWSLCTFESASVSMETPRA